LYHESEVERDLFFIKQLREAKGPKVVGVFGSSHMVVLLILPSGAASCASILTLCCIRVPQSGVINLWNEYERAPYDVWQTTTDGGKDFTRYLPPSRHDTHITHALAGV
jgi:hypothetical protein